MFQEATLGSIEITKVVDLEKGDLSQWEALNVEERLQQVFVCRDKKRLPDSLKTLVTITHQFCKKDKNASFGLIYRRGMVVRIMYSSPFKGYIFPGDVIMTVNGTKCTFEEGEKPAKSISSTVSTLSKLRLVRKKSSTGQKVADFRDIVARLMAQKGDFVKVEIVLARLKSRLPAKIPPEIQITPGFTAETAVLYLFRFIKLGLSMTLIDKKILVNYTAPDSASQFCMNVGESMLLIDDKPVNGLEEVRQQILNGCNVNGYARVLVEYPESDPLKNQVRNMITEGSKNDTQFSQHYSYSHDVRRYMEEGIEALTKGKEPLSILREVIDPRDKFHRKLPAKLFLPTKPVMFVEKTEEVCIPTEWNTKLFVDLPPPKTGETEKKALADMKERQAQMQQQSTSPQEQTK